MQVHARQDLITTESFWAVSWFSIVCRLTIPVALLHVAAFGLQHTYDRMIPNRAGDTLDMFAEGIGLQLVLLLVFCFILMRSLRGLLRDIREKGGLRGVSERPESRALAWVFGWLEFLWIPMVMHTLLLDIIMQQAPSAYASLTLFPAIGMAAVWVVSAVLILRHAGERFLQVGRTQWMLLRLFAAGTGVVVLLLVVQQGVGRILEGTLSIGGLLALCPLSGGAVALGYAQCLALHALMAAQIEGRSRATPSP